MILASRSPQRAALLQQMGVEPIAIWPTEIDESSDGASPRALALARAKAKAAAALAKHALQEGALLLAADTVVAVGRRVLDKPRNEKEARAHLALLSGRAHRVWTAVVVSDGATERSAMSETRLQWKRLAADEITSHVASGEWRDAAGGYRLQGLAGAFVRRLNGSPSGVVGLPLYETRRLLMGFA